MRHVLVTFGNSPAHAGRDAPIAMKIRYYVAKLKRYGLVPVFMWPDMAVNFEALYNWCELVLLTGGGDFNPELYGCERHRETDLCFPGRDEMELKLLDWVFKEKKPVLGVCRGCQALAIHRGGGLKQHIPDLGLTERHGKSEHLHTVEEMVAAKDVHDVIIVPGSRAHRLIGKDRIAVNSFHHQMIDYPGEGMVVSGRSPEGVAEIVESTDRNHFCFGIQSHPERFEESDLDVFFEALSRAH